MNSRVAFLIRKVTFFNLVKVEWINKKKSGDKSWEKKMKQISLKLLPL